MAGLISPNTLEQIRAASDIVEVIGQYLPLKRAGANFVALCPFHKEKTPSFNVNPHRQIFHCFGCHKGGDVFTFVREYENLSFMEAVRRLAERAHIALEFDDRPEQQQARQIKDVLLQMHEQLAQRWQTALTNEAAGQIARDYLAKRQVPPEAVQLFRLGYAPDLWDDTVNWAKSKGYDLAQVEQAGLILRSENAGRYYDRFRGRLMFPICDEQGRVIAFSGRVLSAEDKGAKYVNSPETPIFHKGRVFFGLDKSKRAILDAGFAVICEGQLDLIACYMAGVRNVVAPQGTAFTGDHARILRRYTNEVVLCFDGDTAGQDAAVRVLDLLLPAGLAIRVAPIPPPHDPDSFVKEQGPEAFQKLIASAVGFFDFYLSLLCARHDPASDKGRLEILREMGVALKKADNSVLLDTYAQKTAFRLGVSPNAVLLEFRKTRPPKALGAESAEAPPSEGQSPRPPGPELRLLQIGLSQEETIPLLAARLDLNWLTHDLVRRALALRLAAHHSQSWPGLGAFLMEIEEADLRNLLTEALADDRPIAAPEPECLDLLRRLRSQFIDRQQAALLQRLAAPELAEAEKLDLLRQHQELSRLKRQPL